MMNKEKENMKELNKIELEDMLKVSGGTDSDDDDTYLDEFIHNLPVTVPMN